MHRQFLAGAMLLALTSAGPVSAELLLIDGQVQVRAADLPTPTRGMSMREVSERFGEPSGRADAVGQPPITRWDYAQFSVYFENDRVLHTVVRAG